MTQTPATTITMDPWNLTPWHEPIDQDKLDELIASMQKNGWQGAPIVVIFDEHDTIAICGSHRIRAARECEIDVPVIDLNDLLLETGATIEELDKEYDSDSDHYEAVVMLPYHLSAETVEAYGLDAH